MSPIAQIALVGLGTYLLRVSAIVLADRFAEPSEAVVATLRLIGPAVLAAIVADQLLPDGGRPVVQWTWWAAAIVAIAVARRWRSAGLTMAVGMAMVWLLDPIVG